MRRTRVLASLGAIPLLLLGTGCGKSGGGGGTAAADPNAPVIANLRVSLGGGCALPSGAAGTVETLAFDYADADGNVTGGMLENTGSATVGGPITLTLPIPGPGVTISGTTSGTITTRFCLHFGDSTNASINEQVKIVDASGKPSNELQAAVQRPSGAPLLPRGTDPTPSKSLLR